MITDDGSPSAQYPEPDFRRELRSLIAAIEMLDDLEARHVSEVLAWIDSGAPIHRTAKPATPAEHLVSYCVLVDQERRSVLLVDHRDAQKWLPTGGHVDLGESPQAAARRELQEELGIQAEFHPATGDRPLFLTRTRTEGPSTSHVDVSLWYGFTGSQNSPLVADEREFASVRWWPFDEVVPGRNLRFDPHLPRFLQKLDAYSPDGLRNE